MRLESGSGFGFRDRGRCQYQVYGLVSGLISGWESKSGLGTVVVVGVKVGFLDRDHDRVWGLGPRLRSSFLIGIEVRIWDGG